MSALVERPDRVNVGNPDYGRWIPSIDSLPTGTPESATSPYRDMLLNHSYYIYSTPKPFDWFVYGFGLNRTAVQIVGVDISISTDEERENLSLRTIDASAVLGYATQTPEIGTGTVQINPHWLPLPGAYCFEERGDGIWGWFNAETEGGGEFGGALWAGRKNCRISRPPYKVTSGKQLRFIIANRFTAELPNTVISVMGTRWLPWSGDAPARKVVKQ